MKPDKKIIQQQTELYFNNHKKWYFENLEALEYKEQFIVQEIDRTDSAIKDLEKHLQNPDLRSDDNISYLQGGYKYLEFLKKEYQKYLPPQQTETKTEQETIELKPILKPEAVLIVFDILKDFFKLEHQTELKTVIETGNKASKKLLFKGNGNRLTDTFKKLIEHDFITGCQKQDLINWIISNFTFTQQNKVKAFVYDTVEKTISRNYYPCKSPLIEIKNGQIQRFEQPRTKKYR